MAITMDLIRARIREIKDHNKATEAEVVGAGVARKAKSKPMMMVRGHWTEVMMARKTNVPEKIEPVAWKWLVNH